MSYVYQLHMVVAIQDSNTTVLGNSNAELVKSILISKLNDGWEIYDKSVMCAGNNAVVQYIIRKDFPNGS